MTLQVACARKQKHVTPPHRTVFVSPGQTKTAVATCPGRRHLFGGGFQRTDFTARGGDYVTESRAISAKSWSVTGRAFGGFGGELTAIAYCWRSKKPLLTEVSGSTSVGTGHFATRVDALLPDRSHRLRRLQQLAGRSPPLHQRRLHGDRRLVGLGDEPFRPDRKLHGVRLLPEALDSLAMERTVAVESGPATGLSRPAIELRRLRRDFGDRPALAGVSARLEPGESLARARAERIGQVDAAPDPGRAAAAERRRGLRSWAAPCPRRPTGSAAASAIWATPRCSIATSARERTWAWRLPCTGSTRPPPNRASSGCSMPCECRREATTASPSSRPG